jgi:hypothetical protein
MAETQQLLQRDEELATQQIAAEEALEQALHLTSHDPAVVKAMQELEEARAYLESLG